MTAFETGFESRIALHLRVILENLLPVLLIGSRIQKGFTKRLPSVACTSTLSQLALRALSGQKSYIPCIV